VAKSAGSGSDIVGYIWSGIVDYSWLYTLFAVVTKLQGAKCMYATIRVLRMPQIQPCYGSGIAAIFPHSSPNSEDTSRKILRRQFSMNDDQNSDVADCTSPPSFDKRQYPRAGVATFSSSSRRALLARHGGGVRRWQVGKGSMPTSGCCTESTDDTPEGPKTEPRRYLGELEPFLVGSYRTWKE